MEKKLYSLTNPQKSIYYTEEYYKGTNINNIAGTMTINGPVDFEKFTLAIKQFIKQNDSCRTMLTNEKENIMQYINSYEDFDIEIVDVASKGELSSLANEIVAKPFSIYNSYLFKFVIFRFPNNHGGFIVNIHHLIADSWTLGIVVNEIIEIYSSYIKNEPYTSKDSSTYSYINYIEAENEYKSSGKYEKDKAYWNELFSTIPDSATIPSISTISNSNDSTNALREECFIPSDLLNQIKEYCSENKASIFNFLTAVFSLYVSRVSNLEDFCIGTPILNRSNFKEKNTTGMFVSTLPLRVSIDNTLSFSSFLSSIATNSMSLLRHQKYSYQSIIEDLRKRQNDLPALYNIMISYQITKMNEEQETIPHDSVWYFNKTIADDIDIHIFDLNDTNELNIAYDYKIDKYTAEDMKNIHNRVLTIISQVLENKDIKLSDIEIVTDEEKHKLIYEFNNTKTDYPKNKTVTQLFEEQVKLTPDNVALVFEGTSLTYKELNEKANKLAYVLFEKGIHNNDVVSLFMEKSLESIIGILAIFKVGATFLPLDVQYPKERIDYILENSNSKLILATKSYLSKIETTIPVTDISLELESIYGKNSPILNKQISSSPLDLAYIMYTSGSTGNPKGVMVCHQNIVRLVKNTNYIKFQENERILQTGSIVFDACTFEIWGALLNGYTLYLIPKEKLLDIAYLENYLKENKITIIWLTASLSNYICEQAPSIFNSVHYLLTGGDVLSVSHIQKIQKGNPNLTVINGYGPTENTTFSTCYTIDRKLDRPTIPIGYPIANSTCYIVSKSQKLQPIGAPGELWVGGDGVGLGYLNRDDLTKEKFLPNPFAEGRIYRTGDLTRILPDGRIEFLGRIDNQVKIRGFRVELSEIDSKLKEYSGVKQTYTLVKKQDNQSIICSYITAEDNIDIKQLKLFLKSSLPAYMVPTYITVLKQFPLNINGKIDHKALPEPTQNASYEVVKPRNDLDKIIINCLQTLLHQNEISIEDSFFDLGGDSLSAIHLCTMLYGKINIKINVKDILTYPIIKDLSDFIAGQVNAQKLDTIEHIETKDFYPASSAQKRIYYASQMDENSTLYNIAGGLLLDSYPDVKKLENCLKKLINRHSSLRTYFAIVNDNLVQKVTNEFDFTLDVENGIWKDRENIIKNYVKTFDLHKPLLFRTKLILFENKKTLLLIDMHHSISDGTSLSILLKELTTLYNDGILEDKKIDYKDYSAWENKYFESMAYEEDKNYWLDKFSKEVTPLDMPMTLPRPTKKSIEGNTISYNLDKTLSKSILEVSKQLNITPYMLMLSAYFILLYKYTGEEDITIGTPIMNREKPELNSLLGMFVNNLALRLNLNTNSSVYDYFKQVKSLCLNAFEHQNYPFDELVKDLKIKRDVSRSPIFDTMFIYQNNGFKDIDLGDIHASYYIPKTSNAKFDLALEIIPNSDDFSINFEYCIKIFTDDYIKRLLNHYINILKILTKCSPSTTIGSISILGEDEITKIQNEFNNTYMPYNKNISLVNLFEKQVELHPNDIAIVFEDISLTYKELNEKANQLAHYLVDTCNIKRNQIVGIMLNRSIETIISMLAIIKSGAAYLLIDSSLPFDRILYMLDNSNATLLITDSTIKKIDFTNKLFLNELNLNNYSKNNLNIYISNEDILSIVYTSGSTGLPKGVIVKKLGMANLILSYKNHMKIDNYSTFLSICSISFDMFAVEIWIPFTCGKKVILANEEQCKIPIYIGELITKYKIDYMLITPSKLKLLIDSAPNCLNVLKSIQLGGESLTPSVYENLAKLTNATICNEYGPSECTSCSTYKVVTDSNKITIGKPFYNTQIYICDKDSNLRPIGFSGEICISGDGVSLGYINNEDLTKNAFIDNPFGPGKLYKTGDIGAFTENGEIVYIGRKDYQVKIRGLRIELSEIEKQISLFPNINNVAVVCHESKDSKYIVCYYTSNTKIDPNDIRTYLAQKLPAYMIPKYILSLEALPLSSNGKIDKKALENMEISLKQDNVEKVAPQNETQKLFCDIWSNLLNTPIGIDDDLFESGADSLLAIKFKTELLAHKINIPYSDIFKYTTIRELSKAHEVTNNEIKLSNNEEIKAILQKNNEETLKKNITCNKNNNILLLGGNGFVGSHIINEFIKNDTGKIYCIVRNKGNNNAYERFINVLHFYFGNTLDSYIGKRIFVITGNVLEEDFGLSHDEFINLIKNISTIVNAAAIVKHYGNEKNFKIINVDLTKSLVKISKEYNKRFIHISSTSVCGNSDISTIFSEADLDIGQKLQNVYVKSKFKAEEYILQEINNGLNAQILRLGNITNRYEDGKFQINSEENSFVNRIKSFVKLKMIPNNILKIKLEFTPVDVCAKAIILIIENELKDFSIFHLFNDNTITMEELLNYLDDAKYQINIVSNKDFDKEIEKVLKDKSQNDILYGIINDLNTDISNSYTNQTQITSNLTMTYLSSLNFNWPKIDKEYINKYIKYFKEIELL